MSLNEQAMAVCNEMANDVKDLSCAVSLVADARIIDAGIDQLGSIHAGIKLAQASMANFGSVHAVPGHIGQVATPQIVVSINQPVAACMASQYAGWQICVNEYFAMGSGPMRAAYGKEALYDHIGWREDPHCVVGILETEEQPTNQVISYLAESCRVNPQDITLIAARTASLAGGVQVVARSVETAMHKLHELGFDLHRVIGGFGQAPLPPVAEDHLTAIGRTNDAILYGARCTLYVTGDDQSLNKVGEQLPSSASKDYGQPFAEIFKRYNHDFYKIDPMLFSPAVVCLQNIETGTTRTVGQTNTDVLTHSFF